MNPIRLVATVVVAFVACAAEAASQEPPPGRVRLPSGPSGLGAGILPGAYADTVVFSLPAVKEELKLTDEQKARMKAHDDKSRQARLDVKEQYERSLKELGEKPDRAARVELLDASDAIRAAINAKSAQSIRSTLDRDQYSRFRQIHMQVEGCEAFSRPEVQERLNLSPEQIEAIGEIAVGSRSVMQDALTVPAAAFPDLRTATREEIDAAKGSKLFKDARNDARNRAVKVREDTMKRIFKVLTRTQRARYQNLIGKPFDFKRIGEPSRPATSEPAPAKKP